MPESTNVTAAAPGEGNWLADLRGRMARNQWLFADQALVSSSNFLTSALLARALGVRGFGIYSVYYIALQYLNSIQLALIVPAMMSIGPQLDDAAEQRAFLYGMAGYQYLFSLACAAAAAVATLLAQLHFVKLRVESGLLLPFLLTILCFQLQDWYRRFCYAQDRGRAVFWNDAISYIGQLAILIVLWRTRWINVNLAFYAIAATSLAAFVVGFFRDRLRTSWREIRRAFARSWAMGRSLLVASQSQWLGSQGIVLVVAGLAGLNAAAGIRAAVTLFGPLNVFYQLMDNVMPVRAARAYAQSGESGLERYLLGSGPFLVALVGLPVLAVCVFARLLMTRIFGGAYALFAPLVAWEGAYVFLALIYRGLTYYFRTLESTAVIARTALAVSAVAVAACVLLARRYGAVGGMQALVVGQVLNVSILLFLAMRAHRTARAVA
jgi:O-antigen/teichoic acid export membrane protein